jgi:spore coat polysaccharide biosynthesis predicted glycosyltransferase SpsG
MPVEKKTISFRTKGNHRQGMGDVTGSLTIAEELRKRGYNVSFVINDDKAAIDMVLEAQFSFSVVENEKEEDVWNSYFYDLIVVNQLNTNIDQLSIIRKYCRKLITIDDTGKASRSLADLRINPLYYDDGALCEPSFIPLHPMYQETHAKEKVIHNTVEQALLTMGGSDTYGLTPQIVEALRPYSDTFMIKVIIGPAFQNHKELRQVLSMKESGFEIIHAVPLETMCRLIQEADIGVCAAGNTLFEMACCGTPVLTVCNEPFEEETAYRLEKMGFGLVVPFNKTLQKEAFHRLFSRLFKKDYRKKQSLRGQELIDGKGISRIADEAISLLD